MSQAFDPQGASLNAALAIALRRCGTAAGLTAARRLDAEGTDGPLTVHLRDADLDAVGAQHLARAFASVAPEQAARLRSFSLSYNAIGDAGAVALAAALPLTLSDLGLVSCGLGDGGMTAMLEWSKRATGLRMICIENNAPSNTLRDKFASFGRARSGLSVYI